MNNLEAHHAERAVELMTRYADTARAYESAMLKQSTTGALTDNYREALTAYESARLEMFSVLVSGFARQGRSATIAFMEWGN